MSLIDIELIFSGRAFKTPSPLVLGLDERLLRRHVINFIHSTSCESSPYTKRDIGTRTQQKTKKRKENHYLDNL